MPQMEAIKDYRLSVIASDNGMETRSTVCQIKIGFERVQSKVVFHEPLNKYIRYCLTGTFLYAVHISIYIY